MLTTLILCDAGILPGFIAFTGGVPYAPRQREQSRRRQLTRRLGTGWLSILQGAGWGHDVRAPD